MVTFTASIKVTSCPKDPKEWNQIFQIYPVGINENLIIEMQMLCDCPCERKDSAVSTTLNMPLQVFPDTLQTHHQHLDHGPHLWEWWYSNKPTFPLLQQSLRLYLSCWGVAGLRAKWLKNWTTRFRQADKTVKGILGMHSQHLISKA